MIQSLFVNVIPKKKKKNRTIKKTFKLYYQKKKAAPCRKGYFQEKGEKKGKEKLCVNC